MSRVTLERLVKRYDRTEVVRGIDLSVEEGEFIVLLGPSGCGKTTTLRMIAGFIEPTSGTVRIGGEVWTARSYDETEVIPAGEQVEVVEIRGATALVMP